MPTPTEARQLLYEDAYLRHREGLSVSEWEERISEEKSLSEAMNVAGPKVVDAITRLTWEWDRPAGKRKRK